MGRNNHNTHGMNDARRYHGIRLFQALQSAHEIHVPRDQSRDWQTRRREHLQNDRLLQNGHRHPRREQMKYPAQAPASRSIAYRRENF
jgi:hypothetical protein